MGLRSFPIPKAVTIAPRHNSDRFILGAWQADDQGAATQVKSGKVGSMKATIVAHSETHYRRPFKTFFVLSVALLGEVEACNSKLPVDSSTANSILSADTIAVVNSRILTRDHVAVVAARPTIVPGDFVRGWTVDVAFAEAARAGALDSGRVRQVERSGLARSMLELLYKQALNQGSATPKELADMTAEHWFEVDRPAAAQTTHFVVRTKDGRPTASAESLAHRIADNVRNVMNAEEFKAAVNVFPRQEQEVIVESLPPVTSDGRSLRLDANGKPVGSGPTFDPAFAQAANAIEREGGQSGIVRTQFGFHVILLERKYAPEQSSIQFRRERFASDIILRRARQAVERQIQDSRQYYPVQIESSFQEVIAQLRVLE